MAESPGQRKVRCQINYLPDRHVLQKMSEVDRRLVPGPQPAGNQPSGQLTTAEREKDRRHLRSSFL